jgi:putative nucleotidyltransferase with HDIG domain
MPQAITIQDILRKTTDLPSMPAAANAVMHEAESATSSSTSIARHLRQDQALSARVLRLANSSYYGLSRQVSEVGEAVVILGTRTVRHLCLVAASYPWLTRDLKGYELGPAQLWRHSFATAVSAGVIANHSGMADRDVCFTAGLLHNIGKVALSVWLEGKTAMLQVLAERAGMSFDEVERKALGFDHAQIGEALAEQWNLPEALVQAIRYHHEPNACPIPNTVVDVVHLGDYLATTMGYGLGADGLRYRVYDESFERLGIPPERLEHIMLEFMETYEREEKVFDPDTVDEAA